jgi:hypothetical protein
VNTPKGKMNKLIFITLFAAYLTSDLYGQDTIKFDVIKFKKTKCGLFVTPGGDIAYQTRETLNDNGDQRIRYITWIYGADVNDTLENAGLMEMKFVIDTTTFEFLSWVYWADKNRVYGFTPMSDGGTVFYIDGADPVTFRALGETPYAKDKRNIFYKGRSLEGADIKSFRIIKDKKIPELAKDRNRYYFSGDPIAKIELKKLKKR